jgi:arylsulfatase A-like enzyme
MIYYSSSLLLSFFTSLYYQSKIENIPRKDYQFGLPEGSYFSQPFTLEGLFEGIADKIVDMDRQESPFFAYFHIYPPHGPYRPRKEFFELFNSDGYSPVVKPVHILSGDSSQAKLDAYRDEYDGYLANIDMEIGRMITMLEKQGVLEHTHFILTSDHGESFERGINGHFNPLLYEPGIRIPLLVLAPGNQSRQDFFNPTSNIDILPTILSLAGKEIPDSCEGNVLPGLGGSENLERSIITVEAKESTAFRPLEKATFAIVKGSYKLIYYKGYKGVYRDHFEFYNLEEDPEELHDRMSKPKYEAAISQMKAELLTVIEAADKPYS